MEWCKSNVKKQAVFRETLRCLQDDRKKWKELGDGILNYNVEKRTVITIIPKFFACDIYFGGKIYTFSIFSYMQILNHVYFTEEVIKNINHIPWRRDNDCIYP